MDIRNLISLMDKNYTEKLIYSVIHFPHEIVYVLGQKLKETNFFRLESIRQEIPDEYISLLESVFTYKIAGKNSEEIKELIKSNPLYRDIYREVEAKYDGNLSYNEMNDVIKEFIKKVKIFLLLNFIYSTVPIINNINILNSDEEINRLINRISKLYDDISFEYKTDESVFDNKEAEKFIEELINEDKGRYKVIKTGIELLDLSFDDLGLRTKELFIISSGWGVGKTRFVSILGSNFVKQGHVVYHITIENSLEDVKKLYATAFTNISFEYIRILTEKLKYVSDENVKSKILEILTSYKETLKQFLNERKLIIKKFPIDDCTVSVIDAYIKQCISRGLPKPDVIIVDHMDLLLPSSGDTGNMFINGQEVSKELKGLAEKYDAVVIAPSQLNVEGVKALRKGFEAGGEMGSRSRAKFEIASYHITLNQTQEEITKNVARLYIDKNRHGLSMLVIPIYFDKNKMIMYDINDVCTITELYMSMFDRDDRKEVKKAEAFLRRILSSIKILQEKKRSIYEDSKLIPDEKLLSKEFNTLLNSESEQDTDNEKVNEIISVERETYNDDSEVFIEEGSANYTCTIDNSNETELSEGKEDINDTHSDNKDIGLNIGNLQKVKLKIPQSILGQVVSIGKYMKKKEELLKIVETIESKGKIPYKEFIGKYFGDSKYDKAVYSILYNYVFNPANLEKTELHVNEDGTIRLKLLTESGKEIIYKKVNWIWVNIQFLNEKSSMRKKLLLGITATILGTFVNKKINEMCEKYGIENCEEIITDIPLLPFPFFKNGEKRLLYIPVKKLTEDRYLAIAVSENDSYLVILEIDDKGERGANFYQVNGKNYTYKNNGNKNKVINSNDVSRATQDKSKNLVDLKQDTEERTNSEENTLDVEYATIGKEELEERYIFEKNKHKFYKYLRESPP